MEHIAIDLGSRQSQVCVRGSAGEILLERRVPTPEIARFLSQRPHGARVLVESSCEAFTVADWAVEAGHEARVVPSSLVRALGVGERGLKTDKRDARKLSEVDCRLEVPSIHIPSAMRREHQARVTARDALVQTRTKLVNTVRSYLRSQALPTLRCTAAGLPKAVRKVLQSEPEGVPDFLEHLLTTIESMNAQIGLADEALKEIGQSDPVCKLLQTMPGVGPITAVCFASAIDDVSRFRTSAELTSYLGLTPGEATTGFKTRRTSLTKAGSSRARWTLNQAAWTLVRTQPDSPIGRWYESVAGRRGKKIAICAVSRKMAAILFSMWRDQQPYNPQKAARAMS